MLSSERSPAAAAAAAAFITVPDSLGIIQHIKKTAFFSADALFSFVWNYIPL